MAENGNSAAANTPNTGLVNTNTGGGAAQPAQDSISLPRAEYEKYVRYGEQVKGFQPFYEKAKGLGIKSAEDFDRYDPYIKTISELEKRGIKHDMLGRMFSGDADADLKGEEGQKQNFDPAKFKDEFRAEFKREQALEAANESYRKEDQYVDQAFKKFVGDDQLDGMSAYATKLAFKAYMDSIRDPYPDNHPAKEYGLMPLTEAQVEKAVKHFQEKKAEAAGQSMKERADKVLGTKAGSSAGRSGGSGAPDTSKQKGRAGGLPSAASVEAAYEARRAARGGGSA